MKHQLNSSETRTTTKKYIRRIVETKEAIEEIKAFTKPKEDIPENEDLYRGRND